MPQPIVFTCRAIVRLSPGEIFDRIIDVSGWIDFKGYAPLPGIRSAEFVDRRSGIVGSVISVKNSDGSAHTEEIVEWHPDNRVVLRLQNFSPPLSRLATHFDEVWEFRPLAGQTSVSRTFSLYAKSNLARPALWVISLLLRRAVANHLASVGT